MTARALFAGIAVLAAACGGGGGGGGSSTPTGPSTTPTPTTPTTITIQSTGVSPNQVRIEVGQQVRFVNSGSRNMEVTSDPHPTHTQCPPLNLGMLAPGQSSTATFTQRGTCTFHDHQLPDDPRFRGSVLVGVVEPGPAPDYVVVH